MSALDVETWAFIGGPVDGELRKLTAPLPRVHILVPRALCIHPEDEEGAEAGGTRNVGEYHWYKRMMLGASDGHHFYFYGYQGLTYSAALAALFSRFSEPPTTEGWVVMDGDAKLFRTWRDGMPRWTDQMLLATRYMRRQDAEAVHREDEEAWRIIPFHRVPAYMALSGTQL